LIHDHDHAHLTRFERLLRTFAGSDRGGQRAAAVYTLIETCKLNGIDPRAWLADVLSRLPDYPASRIDELLPWNWGKPEGVAQAA
jgi:transposase